MCGRFTLTIEALEMQNEFELDPIPEPFFPRYNISPAQTIAVVSNENPRKMELMRWGLIPYWAKDPVIGAKMINARCETLAEKPSFRTPFQKRRCLILADGFYEWKRTSGTKPSTQPFYFQLKEGGPFAFAGLWEKWLSPEKEEIRSCAIITCPANDLVLPVHERMPVILKRDERHLWLENDARPLLPLLRPLPSEEMVSYPVSRLVNSPLQDSPLCIQKEGG